MINANMKQWLPAFVLLLWILFTAVTFYPAQAQSQPLLKSRHNQALHIADASETWTGKWFVTSTALTFPDGGKAGFYRRVTRSGRAVPYKGRQGVLYLYPETRYRPARISKRYIDITQENSRLVLGVSANRNPNGKWLLRVLIDGKQLGEDVVVSGKDGWQDIAFNLSGFLGRLVDIDVEAHTSNTRAAYVYIDYIHMENPAGHPVTSLIRPNTTRGTFRSPAVGTNHFDGRYHRFLEISREIAEKRRQNMLDRYEADRFRKKP